MCGIKETTENTIECPKVNTTVAKRNRKFGKNNIDQ